MFAKLLIKLNSKNGQICKLYMLNNVVGLPTLIKSVIVYNSFNPVSQTSKIPNVRIFSTFT